MRSSREVPSCALETERRGRGASTDAPRTNGGGEGAHDGDEDNDTADAADDEYGTVDGDDDDGDAVCGMPMTTK